MASFRFTPIGLYACGGQFAAIANAAYKRQRRNESVTEIERVPNRGHSLTIDHGWREVAEKALAFVKRFV